MVKLFEGAIREWKFVLKFCLFALGFFLVEFLYQLYGLPNTDFGVALIRSSAFVGATFMSFALLLSVIFKFRPELAKYWTVRRAFGVSGTFYMLVHIFAVTNFVFMGDVLLAYSSLNPFENPIIWGAIAQPIFLLLALISTDWAMQKLGGLWKRIQQLVYIGFFFLIFHFITINPPALFNLAGFLLIAATVLTLAGELYWFIKIAREKKFPSLGTVVGLIMIIAYLVLIYTIYFSK